MLKIKRKELNKMNKNLKVVLYKKRSKGVKEKVNIKRMSYFNKEVSDNRNRKDTKDNNM